MAIYYGVRMSKEKRKRIIKFVRCMKKINPRLNDEVKANESMLCLKESGLEFKKGMVK